MAADPGYEWLPLARELEKRLRNGIVLSRDTLRFMASTFSIESPRELRGLLNDPEESDAQTLLELLFSPDTQTRVDLEEVIARYACTAKDEQAIIVYLSRQKIGVPIQFPGAEEIPTCNPGRALLETWVRGLNLAHRLPEALATAIDNQTSGRFRYRVKAALRSTRVPLSRPICTFLDRLLAKSDHGGQQFWDDLDLCLSLFSEQPDSPALYDLFMAKKRRLLTALQQAEKFEKQLAAHNIETLMLRGVRTPHIDQAKARHQITRIDAICLAVFGVTDPLLQVPDTADLGDFTNRDDLDRAFEILS